MAKKLTTKEFIRRACETHGNKYDYAKSEYVNKNTKILITCPIHGDFWQNPKNHYNGAGCPQCAKEQPSSQKLSKDEFLEKCNKIHNNKYRYNLDGYENTASIISIVCPEHGEFKQKALLHMHGHGCKKCQYETLHRLNVRSKKDFIKEAQKVHGQKFDYSLIDYINSKTKIQIICPKHGEFWQIPSDHLKGAGCPQCANEENVIKIHESKKKNGSYKKSKEEEELYKRLLQSFNKSDIERQYHNEKYPFACDFYIKSKDLFIEYNGFYMHGGYWFNENNPNDMKQAKEWLEAKGPQGPVAYKTWTERDVLKRQTAKKNDLNYVVLWNKNDIENWFSDKCPTRKDWL